MSLWAQSCEEYDETKCIEYDWGFITYRFINDVVFMPDLYIVPDKRRLGFGLRLLTEVESIAKREGKLWLASEIRLSSKGAVEALKAHLGVGFKPTSAQSDIIVMSREVPRG